MASRMALSACLSTLKNVNNSTVVDFLYKIERQSIKSISSGPQMMNPNDFFSVASKSKYHFVEWFRIKFLLN